MEKNPQCQFLFVCLFVYHVCPSPCLFSSHNPRTRQTTATSCPYTRSLAGPLDNMYTHLCLPQWNPRQLVQLSQSTNPPDHYHIMSIYSIACLSPWQYVHTFACRSETLGTPTYLWSWHGQQYSCETNIWLPLCFSFKATSFDNKGNLVAQISPSFVNYSHAFLFLSFSKNIHTLLARLLRGLFLSGMASHHEFSQP